MQDLTSTNLIIRHQKGEVVELSGGVVDVAGGCRWGRGVVGRGRVFLDGAGGCRWGQGVVDGGRWSCGCIVCVKYETEGCKKDIIMKQLIISQ